MRTNLKAFQKIIYVSCLAILVYGCFKGEGLAPYIPSTEIRINASVPEIIYLPKKIVTLDARPTLVMNGKRTLRFKWSCPVYPANTPPNISNPDNELTLIDSLRAGSYQLLLAVTDTLGNSAVSQFTMVVKNDTLSGPPKMNILSDTTIYLPQKIITLNGAIAYSVNPMGRDLFFQWSLIQQPAGSPPINIHYKTNPVTNIDGYVSGTYLFRLEVKNEIGLSVADTMELNIVRDSLSARSKIYENLTWDRGNDGWDFYYFTIISDPGVFINRTESNMEVRVWDHERQIWSAPDKYGWFITPDKIQIIHYALADSIFGSTTKAKVTFY